jgi:hypothetical protein
MILHILRKDLRRHCWEIGSFVLVCAVWTWQTSHPYGWVWMHQRQLVPILLFALWFILAVRAVQGECLVGDREFWPTRPYRWPELLAAKKLLLILCLNVPLLITEIVLLSSAGIPLSWALAPGLLLLQLEFAFFLTFPAWVLATVTETLVQWVLTIVGIALFAVLVSWLPWNLLPPTLAGGENVTTILMAAIVIPAMVFALLWQYARRRVWPARLVLGAAILAVPLMIPIASTTLARSIAYPRVTGEPPMRLSIVASGPDGTREYTRGDIGVTQSVITIPVAANFADSNSIVGLEGYRVTLTGDNGWRWQSPWLNHAGQLTSDWPGVSFGFNMPFELANQLAQAHASARLELAFGVYRMGKAQRIDTAAQSFTLPGVGVCSWPQQESGAIWVTGPACVAPFRLPGAMVEEIQSGDNTCPLDDGEPPLPANHRAISFQYGGDDLPVDFDPNPVRSFNLWFNGWEPVIPSVQNSKINRVAALCRGTPLILRTGAMSGKMSAAFNLGSVGTEKRVAGDPDRADP